MAASTVLNCHLISVYPPVNGHLDVASQLLSRRFIPRVSSSPLRPDITVLWTGFMNNSTIQHSTGTASQFVPLVASNPASIVGDLHTNSPDTDTDTASEGMPSVFMETNLSGDGDFDEKRIPAVCMETYELTRAGNVQELPGEATEELEELVPAREPEKEIVEDLPVEATTDVLGLESSADERHHVQIVEAHKGGRRLQVDGYCFVRNRSTKDKT